MTLNPSRKVRIGVYLFTAVGTPIAVYLQAKGYIGDLEFILWSAEVTVASGLAALNATPDA